MVRENLVHSDRPDLH